MSSFRGAFAIIFNVILLSHTACYAESSWWESYTKAGNEAYAKGDMDLAKRNFESALKEAEENRKGDVKYSSSLNSLGDTYYKLEDYAAAKRFYKDALAIRDKDPNSDDLDIAANAFKLAEAMDAELNTAAYPGAKSNLSGYGEVAELFKRSLSIREKRYGKDSPEIQNSLFSLAMNYLAQGKIEDARPLLRRSMDIQKANLQLPLNDDTYFPIACAGVNNLGVILMNHSDYAEAERLFDEALKLDPNYWLAYLNRSIARRKLGKIAGADEDVECARRLGH